MAKTATKKTTQKKKTATKTHEAIIDIKFEGASVQVIEPVDEQVIDPVIDPVELTVIDPVVELSTDEKNVAINKECDLLIEDLELKALVNLDKWTEMGKLFSEFQLNWVTDNKDGASLSTRAPRKGKTGPESFHQYRQRLDATSYIGRIDDKQFSACMSIYAKKDWIKSQADDWVESIEKHSFSQVMKDVNKKLAEEKLQDATPAERQTIADKEAKKKTDKEAKKEQAKADTEELAARRAGTFETGANSGPAMDFKNGAQLAEAVGLLLKGKDAYFCGEYLSRHNELHGSNNDLKDVTPNSGTLIDLKAIKS